MSAEVQQEVLEFLSRPRGRRQAWPDYRQIAHGIGQPPAVVSAALDALQAEGRVRAYRLRGTGNRVTWRPA